MFILILFTMFKTFSFSFFSVNLDLILNFQSFFNLYS